MQSPAKKFGPTTSTVPLVTLKRPVALVLVVAPEPMALCPKFESKLFEKTTVALHTPTAAITVGSSKLVNRMEGV
jgi:hypothetical protein